MRSRLFACLVVVMIPLLAGAEKDLGDNAALRYWPAFYFLSSRVNDKAHERILSNWDSVPLDNAVEQVIQGDHTALEYLHEGAQIQDCDWGLDYSKGPSLLLPYLNYARSLALLTCVRARWELAHGQAGAAVDDLGDVLAMARHGGRGGALIS